MLYGKSKVHSWLSDVSIVADGCYLAVLNEHFELTRKNVKALLNGQKKIVGVVEDLNYYCLCTLSMFDLLLIGNEEHIKLIQALYNDDIKIIRLSSINREEVLEKLYSLEPSFLPQKLEEILPIDLQIDTVGASSEGGFVISILHRNNSKKLHRCLKSIALQTDLKDVCVIVVDDNSSAIHVENLKEKCKQIAKEGVKIQLKLNSLRQYAAFNFYMMVNTYTNNKNKYLIEMDADDYFFDETSLSYIKSVMLSGLYKKGMGGIKVILNDQDISNTKFFADAVLKKDMDNPRNMSRFSAWLPVRVTELEALRRVELPHYLEIGKKKFLKKNHDTAIHTRVAELISIDEIYEFQKTTYCYDISGENHDDPDLSELQDVEYGSYLIDDDYIRKIWSPLIEESSITFSQGKLVKNEE